MKHNVIGIFIILTLGIALIGCGNFTFENEDGEKTNFDIDDAKDGKVSISQEGEDGKESLHFDTDEEGSTTVTNEEGEEIIRTEQGEGTDLPEGFPEDFPFSDDIQIESTGVFPLDDTKMYQIYFSYSKDPDHVYDAIKEYAEDQEMEILTDQKQENEGSIFYSLIAKGEGESIKLSLNSPDKSESTVNYTIQNN